MPDSNYFDRMAAAFRKLPEDEQVEEWQEMTISDQEEMDARGVRPGVTEPQAPTSTPAQPKAKVSAQEKLAQVLNTEALSASQRELIDSLDLDPEKLTLETMRDLASRYGLPEDQRKLARAAAEELNVGEILTGQSWEPTAEEMESAAKPIREGAEAILTEEYGPDGRKRSTYRGSKAPAADKK